MRSGSLALSLLAVPLNVQVLEALDEGRTPLPDLRRSVGHPPVTTMRSYLRRLAGLGLIDRHRVNDFPGSVAYSPTKSGKQLLVVADVLRHWLGDGPEGPVELGSTASKSSIKALVEGWDTGVLRALAARPLALTELNRLISRISYPSLERRLTAMRQVGLVEPDPACNGRVARCRASEWLRSAAAPLAAAARWERHFIPEQAPAPGRLEAEAVLLLVAPLLDFPPGVDGTCRLTAELRRGGERDFAGVTVAVADGKHRSSVTRTEEEPDAWATGSILDWFCWLSGGDVYRIEIRGKSSLIHGLKGAMDRALTAAPRG